MLRCVWRIIGSGRHGFISYIWVFCSCICNIYQYSKDIPLAKQILVGVSLTLCCFVVYCTRRFVLSYFVLFCSCVFSPFSIAITPLGEERANLSAFCTFVRFALVWFCLFPPPLVSEKGCGLRLWYSLDYYLIIPFLTSKATKKIFLHRYDK